MRIILVITGLLVLIAASFTTAEIYYASQLPLMVKEPPSPPAEPDARIAGVP